MHAYLILVAFACSSADLLPVEGAASDAAPAPAEALPGSEATDHRASLPVATPGRGDCADGDPTTYPGTASYTEVCGDDERRACAGDGGTPVVHCT